MADGALSVVTDTLVTLSPETVPAEASLSIVTDTLVSFGGAIHVEPLAPDTLLDPETLLVPDGIIVYVSPPTAPDVDPGEPDGGRQRRHGSLDAIPGQRGNAPRRPERIPEEVGRP